MEEALLREIRMRKDYLQGKSISTIYFGGGTPSLLSPSSLDQLLSLIRRSFFLDPEVEITMEANPDDLTSDKLKELYDSGINRLSIGIQSFDEEILKFLNRAHNRKQAIDSIENARKVGFRNINMDLIYSIPGSAEDRWMSDLRITLDLFPEHISSYGLTIEPGTVFGKWYRDKKLVPMDEDQAAREYEMLIKTLAQAGYEHYEISNFAMAGYRSRHNTGYWLGEHYLGIGPGAHSYNGSTRQFNINNNSRYIKSIVAGELPASGEKLSLTDQANEYLLTSLRTSWGVDLKYLKERFSLDLLKEQEQYLDRLISGGLIAEKNHHLILTDKGKLLADQITEDLFLSSP
jgi:oxygen-independent coproporphyrinogen-3 oxidase